VLECTQANKDLTALVGVGQKAWSLRGFT